MNKNSDFKNAILFNIANKENEVIKLNNELDSLYKKLKEEDVNIDNYLKCKSCGLFIEKERVFKGKDGINNLCFNCY